MVQNGDGQKSDAVTKRWKKQKLDDCSERKMFKIMDVPKNDATPREMLT